MRPRSVIANAAVRSPSTSAASNSSRSGPAGQATSAGMARYIGAEQRPAGQRRTELLDRHGLVHQRAADAAVGLKGTDMPRTPEFRTPSRRHTTGSKRARTPSDGAPSPRRNSRH